MKKRLAVVVCERKKKYCTIAKRSFLVKIRSSKKGKKVCLCALFIPFSLKRVGQTRQTDLIENLPVPLLTLPSSYFGTFSPIRSRV